MIVTKTISIKFSCILEMLLRIWC